MIKEQVQEQNGRIAVRLTLTCAWCAREVQGVAGERDSASGRVQLERDESRFKLLGGRAICVACGGPLFIEEWRPARVLPKLTAADFEDLDTPRGTRAA